MFLRQIFCIIGIYVSTYCLQSSDYSEYQGFYPKNKKIYFKELISTLEAPFRYATFCTSGFRPPIPSSLCDEVSNPQTFINALSTYWFLNKGIPFIAPKIKTIVLLSCAYAVFNAMNKIETGNVFEKLKTTAMIAASLPINFTRHCYADKSYLKKECIDTFLSYVREAETDAFCNKEESALYKSVLCIVGFKGVFKALRLIPIASQMAILGPVLSHLGHEDLKEMNKQFLDLSTHDTFIF